MTLTIFQLLLYRLQHSPVRSGALLVLDAEVQNAIDSLKNLQEKEAKKAYLVNPNFLSDYQAYRLGLSLEVLDTIRSFRSTGGYLNSVDQFRVLVNLPDSVMERLIPQLKFPTQFLRSGTPKPVPNTPGDLNAASAQTLSSISGIGQVLSARIVKFRTALGGFLLNDQLYDVYGLDSIVVRRLLKRFVVKQVPRIEKIPINSAKAEDLAASVYISWDMARKIVAHRERLGSFESWSELEELELIPANRIARIRLYLSLEK